MVKIEISGTVILGAAMYRLGGLTVLYVNLGGKQYGWRWETEGYREMLVARESARILAKAGQ